MSGVAFSGRFKSPLLLAANQAPSTSDSPLQFVMYLGNFCLYTNFSPSLPSLILPTARFISCPAAFSSDIIFNVGKLSPLLLCIFVSCVTQGVSRNLYLIISINAIFYVHESKTKIKICPSSSEIYPKKTCQA